MSLVKLTDRTCSVENLESRWARTNNLSVHSHFVSSRHSLQSWQKNIGIVVQRIGSQALGRSAHGCHCLHSGRDYCRRTSRLPEQFDRPRFVQVELKGCPQRKIHLQSFAAE